MNKRTTITEIPKLKKYIGYIWMSDKDHPKEYNTPIVIEEDLKVTDQSNPFIIEGQLYCSDDNTSYSIKHVDGEHYVYEYDLGNLPKDWAELRKEDIKRFITNRLKASKIAFHQYWIKETDPLCNNSNVLVPGPMVFVGFEYLKEKEEKI